MKVWANGLCEMEEMRAGLAWRDVEEMIDR